MKKVLSAFVLLIASATGYCQETNKEILKKTETEMRAALEKEDYERKSCLPSLKKKST